MKIGIIGSGDVGKTLAKAFKSEDHEVMLGTRNPEKEDIIKFNKESGVKAGTFEEVATFGELLVLSTKGGAAEHALSLAKPQNLSGKIIIDTTNPIAESAPVNGVLQLSTNLNDSLMEQLQKKYADAKFVKAFNSVGNLLMYKPQLKGGKPSMFICGNDNEAKKSVAEILEKFGWEVEDMGKAEAARAIEPLAMLWCIDGFLKNDWMHAFKVLRP